MRAANGREIELGEARRTRRAAGYVCVLASPEPNVALRGTITNNATFVALQ